MNVSSNVEGTKVMLLELEVLSTVIIIGGWGGIVSFLIKTQNTKRSLEQCLKNIVISCFTGFILSAIGFENHMSMYMIIMVAGLGGVFAVPILNVLGERLKKILEKLV
ncbi:phage holin family protein [Dryocola clanedunensis]